MESYSAEKDDLSKHFQKIGNNKKYDHFLQWSIYRLLVTSQLVCYADRIRIMSISYFYSYLGSYVDYAPEDAI